MLGWPAMINGMTEMNLNPEETPKKCQEMNRNYHIQNISREHEGYPTTSCAQFFHMRSGHLVPPLKLPGYEAGSKPTPGTVPSESNRVKHGHGVIKSSANLSFSILFAAGLVHEGCGGQSSILILTTKNS